MTKLKLCLLCRSSLPAHSVRVRTSQRHSSGAAPAVLERCAPAGGWFPYGGGLLSWWPQCCFPHCGAPDDYCRKPLPKVCWPPYSPDYTWAPSEPCCHEQCTECRAQ